MESTKVSETDVLIVGAGNAACMAALAAREAGGKVTLLERAPKERRGGNSAISGGLFRFAFKDFDEIRGVIKETAGTEFKNVEVEPYPKDMFFSDLMRVTEGLADPTLTELLVERSQDVLRWMAQHGVEWELHLTHGAKVGDKRIWRSGTVPVEARGGGKGLMNMHFTTLEAEGFDIRYSARALEMIVDQSGAVEGLVISSPSGRETIRAKAVILASGGFEANPEMRARYLGPDWDLVKVRGTRYNTGDGIRMALDIGAMPCGHWSSCHASVVDAESADVEAGDQSSRYSYPYSIMVNTAGERFVDEGEDLQVYTYAKTGRRILAQPSHIAYQIFDQKTVPLLRSAYQRSRPVIANSVEELASALDIDPVRLKKTIEQFNGSVSDVAFDPSKKDGKATRGIDPPKSNWAVPLDSPPFHAYGVQCGITFTYGGLKIDSKCRVIASDETTIPSLWAAGELTGGFFYNNYPSGSGLMRGAITGYIAGKEAARYVRGQ